MRKVKQIVKQIGETKRGTRRGTTKLKLDSGAGDGTRTRDNLLGGQELYQLSYSRGSFSFYIYHGLLSKPRGNMPFVII